VGAFERHDLNAIGTNSDADRIRNSRHGNSLFRNDIEGSLGGSHFLLQLPARPPRYTHVSRVVTDPVAGAGLRFSERGLHELKAYLVYGTCSLRPTNVSSWHVAWRTTSRWFVNGLTLCPAKLPPRACWDMSQMRYRASNDRQSSSREN